MKKFFFLASFLFIAGGLFSQALNTQKPKQKLTTNATVSETGAKPLSEATTLNKLNTSRNQPKKSTKTVVKKVQIEKNEKR